MKKIFLILSILFSINSVAQVPYYVPSNGLIGWWPFTGNANDNSGNGNNGTASGVTLTTDRNGIANAAFNFDGIDDLISVLHNSQLNSFPFTVSVWFLPSYTFNEPFGLVNKYENASYNGWGLSLLADQFPNQSLHPFYLRDINNNLITGNGNGNIDIPNNYFNGIWNMAVMTVDQSGAKIYMNGNLTTQMPWLGQADSVSTTTQLYFGWYENAGVFPPSNGYFKGKLDDIGVWNRALTECEIATLFNSNNDTCFFAVYDTINVMNYDTTFITVYDTIPVFDTTFITVYDTTFVIDTLNGIQQRDYNNTIKVFPNPTSGQITIDNGNYLALTGYHLKIFNSLNQEIFESAINQKQFVINLSSKIGDGIYYVNILDARNRTVDIRKIVVQ